MNSKDKKTTILVSNFKAKGWTDIRYSSAFSGLHEGRSIVLANDVKNHKKSKCEFKNLK